MDHAHKELDELVRTRHFPCTLSKDDRRVIAGFRSTHMPPNPTVAIIGGEDTSASYLIAKVTEGTGKYIHCYGKYTPTHEHYWELNGIKPKIAVRNDPHSLIPRLEHHEGKRVDVLYFGIETANIVTLLQEWAPHLELSVKHHEPKHNLTYPLVFIDVDHIRGPNGVQGMGYAKQAMETLEQHGLHGFDFEGNLGRIASFRVDLKRN